MSAETLNWLNNNTLIGMTSQRGNAWHYRASEQGGEPNHYDGAIPVGDVVRRLFAWEPQEAPLYARVPASVDDCEGIDDQGNSYKMVLVESRKAIVANDTYDVLGVAGQGYRAHPYQEWLLGNVANILGDELVISSAGLLRNRAVAWVEVSVPETSSVEGFAYRSNLVAATSLDGTLATTYKRTINATVCDNSLRLNLFGDTTKVRVKHSSRSLGKLDEVRSGLAIVAETDEAFAEEVRSLLSWKVNPKQWGKTLDILVPLPEEKGRGLTLALNKRDQFEDLWTSDPRVAPWRGTALGVLQATNTWAHHFAGVRNGVSRSERNMEGLLSGKFDALDAQAIAALKFACA